VDRVLSVEPGKNIVALKNVTINEPFFPGHYPHHPVMPGVLIIEAMAQVAALLSFKSMDSKPTRTRCITSPAIDGARFKRPVSPGDQLIFKVELTRSMRGVFKFKGIAEVDGQLAAEAELMCTSSRSRNSVNSRGTHDFIRRDSPPERQTCRRRRGGAVFDHRRACRDRRGHGDRPACGDQRPHAHWQAQPHLPVLVSLAKSRRTRNTPNEPTRLEIGDHNTIREFCTFNLGTAQDGRL